ncbi:MAG: glycosyltransferase family 4 protein [Mucilaginibacter sp.]|nr:glycosyltransferase family 4 protein [Mucilaginibacter sp.]
MRLAVILTHPIQYYTPVFKLITERNNIELKVLYTLGSQTNNFDPGFKQAIKWDIPLLEGYKYDFIKNTSPNPGSADFNGIVNPDLIEKVESFKPDALLIYGWSYHSHLKILRYFKGETPIIFRGDSTLLDHQNILKATLRFFLLKWVYSHIDHALYTGINNKAYFKKYGINNEQLVFAPHAIDNERFAYPRIDEAKNLRHQLGISDDDIIILFAGKLEQKKAPQLLLKAFSRIQKDNVHLLFMGDGELKNELIETSKSIANVHFLGFTNQLSMPVIYQTCDLFCLPSKGPGETWGLAVNEAMACGKAILLSDKVGCAADLLKPGMNGAIFKSGDLDDLSDQLINLTESKNVLQRYGQNSSELIQDWNFVEIVKSIETLMFTICCKQN